MPLYKPGDVVWLKNKSRGPHAGSTVLAYLVRRRRGGTWIARKKIGRSDQRLTGDWTVSSVILEENIFGTAHGYLHENPFGATGILGRIFYSDRTKLAVWASRDHVHEKTATLYVAFPQGEVRISLLSGDGLTKLASLEGIEHIDLNPVEGSTWTSRNGTFSVVELGADRYEAMVTDGTLLFRFWLDKSELDNLRSCLSEWASAVL